MCSSLAVQIINKKKEIDPQVAKNIVNKTIKNFYTFRFHKKCQSLRKQNSLPSTQQTFAIETSIGSQNVRVIEFQTHCVWLLLEE